MSYIRSVGTKTTRRRSRRSRCVRIPRFAPRHRLLAFEKEDMKELRRLRKELQWSHGNPHGDPLLPLLVDLMLHDTAKHIDILKFIRARTRRP